ncbi:MAG: hypothetical protein ACRD7E_07005 [Bryobacteraceae bacterium]
MGRILRPKMQVLPDSAIVESGTYTITREQPYYLKRPVKTSEPDGTLPAGSRVLLISKGGAHMSLVEDADGSRVWTSSAGLRPIK